VSVDTPSASLVRHPFADLVVGAHRLKLLRDGAEAFPEMLAAIAKARRAVSLETYILRSDRTGQRFADALIDRAKAGVEASLMYDAWGSSVSDAYVAALREAGVRVLPYRPIDITSKRRTFIAARLWRRNHKKSLIVDGLVGFTGGLNIADEYAPVEEGGQNWRDTALFIDGPAAAELSYFFLRTWRREGGPPLDELRYTTSGRRPDPRVSVITSDLRRGQLGIGRVYRLAIRSARRRIWITNAYFLPTLRVMAALERAALRGVDVRIIVAGKTDVPAVLLAARSIYGRLLAAGVRIYEYVGRILHAKTAVIDDDWSTVGSSNLDPQSLKMNLEVNALVRDEQFANAMDAMFRGDLAESVEVTAEGYQKRSWWERTASWSAYLFKDYL
jgi:cardiolipin synthase